MDRLQEMKELLLKLYVLLKGDDFNLSLLMRLETSMSLINKEHKNIESRDNQIFEDLFSKTFKDMQMTSEKVLQLSEFLSLLQIKYSDSKKKNIFNINNEIDRYKLQIKITEKETDE